MQSYKFRKWFWGLGQYIFFKGSKLFWIFYEKWRIYYLIQNERR